MSLDYTYIVTLEQALVTTPSNNQVVGRIWSKNQPFLVLAMETRINTQGAQSASKLQIRRLGDSAVIAAWQMGTAAAATLNEQIVAEDKAEQAAGSDLVVEHITSDGSIIYSYKVFGTAIHC